MKILAMSKGDADDVKKYANISLATFNKWKDFNYDFEALDIKDGIIGLVKINESQNITHNYCVFNQSNPC